MFQSDHYLVAVDRLVISNPGGMNPIFSAMESYRKLILNIRIKYMYEILPDLENTPSTTYVNMKDCIITTIGTSTICHKIIKEGCNQTMK